MPRRLSDEDREIWQRVARTTRRLQASPDPAVSARQSPVPDPGAEPPRARLMTSLLPPSPPSLRPQLDLAPSVSAELARAPVRMDRRTHDRMKRGKLDPEARIDLHGMTLGQAQPALSGFVLSARARGLRLVLVITGKGRTRPADDLGPIPRRPGALKIEVPRWLRSPPLAPAVLEVREAHHRHGGTGAYYVYLRKPA
ncbi:Smr/MutS family protein [Pararhodobacter sp. SW119]|uniref:Smr/MutS family protein n=1 Tax=Pararhodobacter sp. SW119 TaxID=2780075 RepID=UPI001ADFA3AF|nr:Smr/MutS family protein [Pararhodobacter sp. SW119]